MARIRSIKPEFWTSEQVVECSPTARLLFIGLWNFCDDGGNHPASTKSIKMQVFPGDSFPLTDVEAMIAELVTHGLVVEYEAETKRYWHVTGWHHQKIEKPSYKFPPYEGEPAPTSAKPKPPVADDSPNSRRKVGDGQPAERRGEDVDTEGKGKEKAPRFALPDWVPADAWAEYVEMRKRIRKPMTDRAMELAVGELAKLKQQGHDPAAVLNASVLNSWQGLFAPRAGPARGNGNGKQSLHVGFDQLDYQNGAAKDEPSWMRD